MLITLNDALSAADRARAAYNVCRQFDGVTYVPWTTTAGDLAGAAFLLAPHVRSGDVTAEAVGSLCELAVDARRRAGGAR